MIRPHLARRAERCRGAAPAPSPVPLAAEPGEGGPQAVADPISQAWAGRQPSVNKPNPSTLNTLASLVSFFFSPKSYHVNAVYFFFFLV